MTRRQLEQFLAVLEHGSLARAAAADGVAAQSLARSLGVLEHEVGAVLVHRLPHGAVATAAGAAFAPHARAALRALQADAVPAADGGQLLTGDLDVVADPVLAVDPGAALLAGFRRAHPGVRVRYEVPDRADEVYRHLVDGRAEVALGYLPLDGALAAQLRVRVLGRQELHAVLPPEEAALPDPVRLGALAGRDVVDVPGSCWRDVLRAGAEGVDGWRVSVRTAHREAVVPLVLAGAGMAFTAGAAVAWARQQGAVVRSLDPPLTRATALVHHRGRPSPAVAALLRVAGGEG